MLQRKKRQVGRPAESYPLKITPLNLDPNKVKDFRELCDEKGISLSEGIRQLIDRELENEKNESGRLNNPIHIMYDQAIKYSKIEGLDKYIEDNSVTREHWHKFFGKVDDLNRVDKYEALTLTIYNEAKQRKHFLKTGRYLVQ